MDSQKLNQNSKTLKDVLAKRKLHRTPLSGGSKTLLREAVLQLVDHHQQLDLLIKESSSLQSSSRNKITSEDSKDEGSSLIKHGQFSADSCISYLKAQSQAAGIPLATLGANVCVAKLSEALHQYEATKSLVFCADLKSAVESILDIVTTLKESHSFDRMQFVKELNAKGPLPLELVWQLHVKSIMTFDLFITSNLGQPEVFTAFTTDVGQCSLMCVEEGKELCTEIMKDISQFLVSNGYGPRIEGEESSPSTAAVQKACSVLLDTIVGKILDRPDENGPEALAKLFALIRNNSYLPTKHLIKVFSHLLVLVLSHKADITVKDAIRSQEKWSFGKAPSGVTDMYRELLLAMDCKDAVDIIQRVLEQEEVNWKSLLTFSATLLVCFQEAPQMMKDTIDNLLSQSLESCEQDSLIAAFLLARQAANEGPHVFQSYPQWFRDRFGEGTNRLGNRKSVAFFLAFLTSLVPHEPAEYLKAHLKNQPHVPAKSRESLADYNSLAKTRLADLKVPLDSEGIYGSTAGSSNGMKQSGKSQMQDQAMEDVEKSVAAFERMAKIPNNVMEASIFRRPYYIGRFLPALLKPRLLPDVPDSKMKFIEELKCADKIPSGMLQNYEDACAKEASSLLEGAFTDDAFDDCLEPMDALNVSLEKLPSAVLSSIHSQNASANGIAQHISVISDRLGTVLDSITHLLGDADCVILDLDKSTQNENAQHMQVVDIILDSFCKTCLAVKSSNIRQDTGSTNTLWASQMVAMLSKHKPIIGALYHRLWNLVYEQGNTLSSPHIHGIAVFLVNLQVSQHLFPPVFISGASDQQSDGSLLHQVCRSLLHHNTQWIKFSLQFASEVVHYGMALIDRRQAMTSIQLIPGGAVQKICYLLPRVCPDVRQCITNSTSCKNSHRHRNMEDDRWSVAVQLYHSQHFKELLVQFEQVTFQEWLTMEMQVEPHNDELTDINRQDYYRWAVHSHFLTRPIQDGGCGGSYKHTCSLILGTLLDNDIESSLHSKRTSCCHGNKGAERIRNHQNGCRSEIIQLLQELIPLLSSDSSSDSSLPWLLSIIHNKMEGCKEDNRESKIEVYVVCFMRLACSLPAYLLYANNPGQIPSVACRKSACDFINCQLRSYDQLGAYGLSMITTSYILRAILHLCQETSAEVCAFVKDVLHICPVFTASLLIHWSKLWPVILNMSHAQQAAMPLVHLNTIHQWAKSLVTHHGNQKEHTVEGSTHNTEPWLLAVAIVTSIMEETNGCKTKNEKIMKAVDVILLQKDSLPQKVAACTVECIAAHMSWDLTWCGAVWNVENLSTIWRLPDVLTAFQEDSMLKKNVFTLNISKMFAVVFFRLLINSRAMEVQAISISPQFIKTLLKMHVSLVELHCQAGLVGSAQYDDTRSNQYTTPLSLEFHLSCTKFLHNYITRCPVSLLQSLDQSVLHLCDEDITTLIRQRLRTV